jgi:hypothetical protein
MEYSLVIEIIHGNIDIHEQAFFFVQVHAANAVPTLMMTTRTHINWLPFVRFEVFTEMTMKNGVFCDVTPCVSSKNRHFGGN